MSELKKIKATEATEIVERFSLELDPEAQALLAPDLSPQAFVEQLVKAKQEEQAIKFLAFALPKREACWWSCLVARQADDLESAPVLAASLTAGESWVFKPSEENRQTALTAGEQAGFGNASAFAAHAAAWSGGSITPPDFDPVEPADDLTGKAVHCAMELAIYGGPPPGIKDRVALFLAMGLDIAKGGNGRVHADGSRIEA